MNLDEAIAQFRLASRELFNNFFRIPDPYHNDGWSSAERFSAVEALLFRKLVAEAMHLPFADYGDLQPAISVQLRSEYAPIMLNRDIDSGYWDHPIKEVANEAKLLFIRFFDWDQLGYRDNRYVRIQVESWPSHPELVGKHGLVDSLSVCFTKK